MQEQSFSPLSATLLCSLSQAEAGLPLALVEVRNTENPHVLRLCEIGLIPGARIELLRQRRPGALLLIRFNNIDLCLDEALADNFWVKRIEITVCGEEE